MSDYGYIENVAVAEKDIEQSIVDSKKGNVTPKEEIINNSLKRLTDRGFRIIHEEPDDSIKNVRTQIMEYDACEICVN